MAAAAAAVSPNAAQYLFGGLGVALAAAITGFITYRISQRTNSGNVDTSQAAEVWKAGTDMRDYLTTQVVGLRTQLTDANSLSTRLLHELELANVAADSARASAEAARTETVLARAETARLLLAVKEVHTEVSTGNALTLGALADNQESRRIAAIPEAERTAAEREHIDTVGIQPEPPPKDPA